MPTDGILTRTLTKSKTDVFTELSKIEILTTKVLTGVCTTEVLIGVCTTEVAKNVESKIVLTTKELKIVEHFVSIVDVDQVTEGCCILVDEVLDTSISDVLS